MDIYTCVENEKGYYSYIEYIVKIYRWATEGLPPCQKTSQVGWLKQSVPGAADILCLNSFLYKEKLEITF